MLCWVWLTASGFIYMSSNSWEVSWGWHGLHCPQLGLLTLFHIISHHTINLSLSFGVFLRKGSAWSELRPRIKSGTLPYTLHSVVKESCFWQQGYRINLFFQGIENLNAEWQWRTEAIFAKTQHSIALYILSKINDDMHRVLFHLTISQYSYLTFMKKRKMYISRDSNVLIESSVNYD